METLGTRVLPDDLKLATAQDELWSKREERIRINVLYCIYKNDPDTP